MMDEVMCPGRFNRERALMVKDFALGWARFGSQTAHRSEVKELWENPNARVGALSRTASGSPALRQVHP